MLLILRRKKRGGAEKDKNFSRGRAEAVGSTTYRDKRSFREGILREDKRKRREEKVRRKKRKIRRGGGGRYY